MKTTTEITRYQRLSKTWPGNRAKTFCSVAQLSNLFLQDLFKKPKRGKYRSSFEELLLYSTYYTILFGIKIKIKIKIKGHIYLGNQSMLNKRATFSADLQRRKRIFYERSQKIQNAEGKRPRMGSHAGFP